MVLVLVAAPMCGILHVNGFWEYVGEQWKPAKAYSGNVRCSCRFPVDAGATRRDVNRIQHPIIDRSGTAER